MTLGAGYVIDMLLVGGFCPLGLFPLQLRDVAGGRVVLSLSVYS